MLRKMIFKTERGEEKVLPVTPKEYFIRDGMTVQTVDVYQLGPYAVPTYPTRASFQLECFLPSGPRSYCVQYTDQAALLAWLQKQRTDKAKLRFIISGTAVNVPVYLVEILYGEQDGTNDLYLTLTLQPYVVLSAPTVQAAAAAPVVRETMPQQTSGTTYTVRTGDTLWGIARKFYGDGALCYKLAAYNGIKNPDLIFTGQVLKIPDVATLGATAAAAPARTATAAAGTAMTVTVSGSARASVFYSYIDKASGKTKYGTIASRVQLSPSAGSKVTVRWVPQSGYGCDRMTLDGKSQEGSKNNCRMVAGKNHTLDLHFVRW